MRISSCNGSPVSSFTGIRLHSTDRATPPRHYSQRHRNLSIDRWKRQGFSNIADIYGTVLYKDVIIRHSLGTVSLRCPTECVWVCVCSNTWREDKTPAAMSWFIGSDNHCVAYQPYRSICQLRMDNRKDICTAAPHLTFIFAHCCSMTGCLTSETKPLALIGSGKTL